MRKAFDTVDHLLLLRKLESFNLGEGFIAWLRHYLIDRQQQTKANNTISGCLPVDRGVPQGSVVGPLLFIAYINDVSKVIVHSSFHLYADDLALVVSGRDVNRIRTLLQEDVNNVGKWCKTNKLTVNTGKTQILWSFSQRSPPNLENMTLFLNDQPLEVVDEFKYLGVVVDRHLSLASHLKKRIDLVRVRLKQLKRIKKASDCKTTLQVYISMVRSIMEYCSFVTDGGPVWAVRQMQTLQNDALRICEGIRDPRGVNIADLHARHKIEMLEPARTRELLGHLHKMSQIPDNLIVPVRELRGNDSVKLRIPRSKKWIYDRSPLYRGATPWNDLEPDVQRLPHDAFMRAIRE